MYCITCQREVDNAQVEILGAHLFDEYTEISDSVCFGPFTTCPPPPVPEHWEDFVQDPDEEGMEFINSNFILMY